MDDKPEMELTQGSTYRIFSLGARDRMIETLGFFEGYMTIGIEEVGLLMRMNEDGGDMAGKIRIVPLHAVLAIDILQSKPNDTKKDDNEIPHYVG
ncbi:MAG: hypothetical protein V1769_01590 [Thermoplasmatota archaeon]